MSAKMLEGVTSIAVALVPLPARAVVAVAVDGAEDWEVVGLFLEVVVAVVMRAFRAFSPDTRSATANNVLVMFATRSPRDCRRSYAS